MYISRDLEIKIQKKLSEVSDLVTQLSEQSKDFTPEFNAFLDGRATIRIENEDQYKKFVNYLQKSGIKLMNRNENFEPFYEKPTEFDYNYKYFFMLNGNLENPYFLDASSSLTQAQEFQPKVKELVFLSDILPEEKDRTLFTSPDMTNFLNGDIAVHVEDEQEYQKLLNLLELNYVKTDDIFSKFNPETPYIKMYYDKNTQKYIIGHTLTKETPIVEFSDVDFKKPDMALVYDMDNTLKQAQKRFESYTDEQKQKYIAFKELFMSGRQLVNEFKERENIEKEEQRENETGPVLE